jgi:hypothetical protein
MEDFFCFPISTFSQIRYQLWDSIKKSPWNILHEFDDRFQKEHEAEV